MSGTDGGTATAAAGTETGTAATTTTTAATTTTTDQATAAAAAGATAQAAAPTIEQLQADVDKWKAMSRQNEAKAKAKTDGDEAQRKLLADVAAKLGIATAGGAPDPAAITAQLEAAQRNAKASSVELAVLRAANRLGADGDALLDSRQFLTQLDGLDPAQPEGIEAAIKAALAASPAKYARGTQAAATDAGAAAATGASTATGTASASTAGDFNGAGGGARQWTDADVRRAKPSEVAKAIEQGLMKTLLGG